MDSKYEPDQYIPTIDAILSVADSNQVTVRKIRNALQELFTVNLEPHKKHINGVILDRYYKRDELREQERELADKRAEMMAQDAIMAARLLKSYENTPVTRSGGRVTKKKGPKTTGPKTVNKNNPFNREMVLLDELAAVIGVNKTSRPQVVKLLWAYIKDRSLQNENDKRQILCDEPLQNLFKKKTVGAFEMNKILTKHIFKEEDISNEKVNQLQQSGKGPVKKHTAKTKSEPIVSDSSSDDDNDEHDEKSVPSTLTSTPAVKLESRAAEPLYDSLSESEA